MRHVAEGLKVPVAGHVDGRAHPCDTCGDLQAPLELPFNAGTVTPHRCDACITAGVIANDLEAAARSAREARVFTPPKAVGPQRAAQALFGIHGRRAQELVTLMSQMGPGTTNSWYIHGASGRGKSLMCTAVAHTWIGYRHGTGSPEALALPSARRELDRLSQPERQAVIDRLQQRLPHGSPWPRWRVEYLTQERLLAAASGGKWGEDAAGPLVRDLSTAPLVVIEDLGQEKPLEARRAALREVIDVRLRERRPTLITSHLHWDHIATRLGRTNDDPWGKAIARRIQEGAQEIAL